MAGLNSIGRAVPVSGQIVPEVEGGDVNTPLFESAYAAIVFALGDGINRIDKAGQAEMIRDEMASIGPLVEASLIARCAPRSAPCSCRSSCCSGQRINPEWMDAITFLAEQVRTKALSGCTAHSALRREYVVRYFTRKDDRVSIEAIAERYGISSNTASAHCAKVFQFFGGTPAHGTKQPVPGLEAIAQEAIEDKLCNIGMVGVAA